MPIGTYVQAWNFVIMVLLAPEAFSFAACLDFAELQNARLRVGLVAMMLHFQLRQLSADPPDFVHATWLVDKKLFSDCIFPFFDFAFRIHVRMCRWMDGWMDGPDVS